MRFRHMAFGGGIVEGPWLPGMYRDTDHLRVYFHDVSGIDDLNYFPYIHIGNTVKMLILSKHDMIVFLHLGLDTFLHLIFLLGQWKQTGLLIHCKPVIAAVGAILEVLLIMFLQLLFHRLAQFF